MKKDLQKLYEEYLKRGKRKREIEEQINELNKKHNEELKPLYKEIEELNNSKETEELTKMLDYQGDGIQYSSLFLDKRLMLGQKISTLSYFKKLLEDKIGEELVLVKYITHFEKKETEWDEYYSYDVKKTMIDNLFLPKSKLNKLYDTFKKLNLNNYKKIIKKIPNVFLLKREWYEGVYKETMETNDENFYCRIYFNTLRNYKEGIFQDDEYNKDIEYDKIIIKCLKYHLKSENLEKNLKEQHKLEDKMRENEEIRKKLLKQKKINKNLKLDLQENEK